MDRKVLRFVCLLTIVMAILASCIGCSSFPGKAKYIDFKKVEAPPEISAVDADSHVLRVAISSVLLP